jgi:REP element-mobilizing transposase RayT
VENPGKLSMSIKQAGSAGHQSGEEAGSAGHQSGKDAGSAGHQSGEEAQAGSADHQSGEDAGSAGHQSGEEAQAGSAGHQSGEDAGSAGHQSGSPSPHRGWYTRGYLPHYDESEIHQVITCRLGDSLPKHILENMQFELRNVAPEFMETKRRKKIEKYLDMEHGSCILKNLECAKIVEDTWKYFNSVRYDLKAYVIMPNHVHVLIKVYDGFELAKIVRSWKSYSARRINEFVKKDKGIQSAGLETGAPSSAPSMWQREYWDRFIVNVAKVVL